MSDLSTSELRRLDLTLLLVFLGLIRHRKALDVAAELGLTQSAISQSLKRLRDIFGDELFLRRPHGMEPTATALALEAPVSAAVEALRGALGVARAFDPASATGLIRVAALDAEQAVLIPAFAAKISKQAPGIRLSVVPLGRAAAVEALSEARVDLALGFIWNRPDSILTTPLYHEEFLVVGPPDILREAPNLSLDDYCAAPHILVSLGGDMRGIVDQALDELGRSRRIVLAVPAFLPTLAASATMGALVTLPSRIARSFSVGFALATANPPLSIRKFTVAAYWHRRDEHDPRLRWALDVLMNSF
jgi:DNA-binding transcriptional LysR family regulator